MLPAPGQLFGRRRPIGRAVGADHLAVCLGEPQEFVVVVQRTVEVLDISGSQSDKVNTLTLNAQDVLDVTNPDNMLVVLDGVEVGTVLVDDDLTMQFETAMALSGRFAGEIIGMRTAGP